nr:ribosomal protein S3 [Haplothismia exannulata]
MGQKINPLGFRLGTNQNHYSFWFAEGINFSAGLIEDEKIRNCIKNYVRKNKIISSDLEGISRIEIKKRIDLIQVIIYIGFPNLFLLLECQTSGIEELRINVRKEFYPADSGLDLLVRRIAKPYGQPAILAEYIGLQFKNRVSSRKAMKKAIELAEQTGVKGIRVQLSGRIGGKKAARVEWVSEGRVPLQTIRARIDYCSHEIRTIFGISGIKIWIFSE